MDVELRQFQAVLAVAEERSFTAAGRRLHLSQQSVSALVRRLEINLGVGLFERTTRSVEPTEACEALLPSIKTALGILESALTQARASATQERALRLGVPSAAGLLALKDLLDAVSELGLPDPEVRELWSDELADAMREGRLDAAIGIEVRRVAGLEVRPWRRQRVDLLVRSSHAFGSLERVTCADLARTTLVLPERTTSDGLHEKLVATLTRAGIQPSIAYAPRMSRTLPAAVERGEAATVWLTGMDDRYVPEGFVHVELGEPEILVTTDFVTPVNPSSSPPVALEVLRDVIEQSTEL